MLNRLWFNYSECSVKDSRFRKTTRIPYSLIWNKRIGTVGDGSWWRNVFVQVWDVNGQFRMSVTDFITMKRWSQKKSGFIFSSRGPSSISAIRITYRYDCIRYITVRITQSQWESQKTKRILSLWVYRVGIIEVQFLYKFYNLK